MSSDIFDKFDKLHDDRFSSIRGIKYSEHSQYKNKLPSLQVVQIFWRSITVMVFFAAEIGIVKFFLAYGVDFKLLMEEPFTRFAIPILCIPLWLFVSASHKVMIAQEIEAGKLSIVKPSRIVGFITYAFMMPVISPLLIIPSVLWFCFGGVYSYCLLKFLPKDN